LKLYQTPKQMFGNTAYRFSEKKMKNATILA